MAALWLLLAGCGPAEELQPPSEESPPLRSHSSELAAQGGVYDIGIIPESSSCPANAAILTIHMDDEDNRNANSRWGWLGAITSDRNTTFRFCRVDGSLFQPLSTSSSSSNHYAVLKLGAFCPPGAHEFTRAFDNEDDSNANWYSGDIYPNVSDRNTRLTFCLFRYGSATMSSFPSLGVGYGVFAASGFSRSLASGFVHTDDEDNRNANSYSASPEILYDAQRLVSGGSNTDMGLAKVR